MGQLRAYECDSKCCIGLNTSSTILAFLAFCKGEQDGLQVKLVRGSRDNCLSVTLGYDNLRTTKNSRDRLQGSIQSCSSVWEFAIPQCEIPSSIGAIVSAASAISHDHGTKLP